MKLFVLISWGIKKPAKYCFLPAFDCFLSVIMDYSPSRVFLMRAMPSLMLSSEAQ